MIWKLTRLKFYVGVVPVTIRPPHPQNLQTTLPTVRMIVDVSKSVLILSTGIVSRLLKSKVNSDKFLLWLHIY